MAIPLLMHSCATVSYTHSRKTDREINRVLPGEDEVIRMSSPNQEHTLFCTESGDHTDPSTVFITFVVVNSKTEKIVYQDRIRGIEIKWDSEKIISILAPIGILNKQNRNTRRYLIDIEQGTKVLSENKEEL